MSNIEIAQISQQELESKTKQAFKKIGKSVCILSCYSHGQRHASISSAVCNVSNSPPSLLVCIEKTASLATLLIEDTCFGVNVLAADQQATLDHCMHHKGEQRFGHGEWSSNTDQPPLLAASQANFCCRVAQINRFETHLIIVALIEQSYSTDETNGLIYLGGKFHLID
ncbi:flavin reductase family protein [Oceanicoccus sp. KOV_DT_Chl]|uniref:flavin reductase family protein n=1 Tax=Oceanicoccus sp. KOV_DT_Chl TaxID=1904639 RepID=UPI000C7CBF0C|nr:flavin reductase family protein [Oceanicoccus sp. KOV_DT_Chl]